MERKVNVNIQTHHNDIYYLHTLLNNTALTHTPGSIAEISREPYWVTTPRIHHTHVTSEEIRFV